VVRYQAALRPESTRIIPKFGEGLNRRKQCAGFFKVAQALTNSGLHFHRREVTTFVA
jgi:hypothetical protein